jgi:hypothetical protein
MFEISNNLSNSNYLSFKIVTKHKVYIYKKKLNVLKKDFENYFHVSVVS